MKKLKNFLNNKEKYSHKEIICNWIILIILLLQIILWTFLFIFGFTNSLKALSWTSLVTFGTILGFIYILAWKFFLIWRRKHKRQKETEKEPDV